MSESTSGSSDTHLYAFVDLPRALATSLLSLPAPPIASCIFFVAQFQNHGTILAASQHQLARFEFESIACSCLWLLLAIGRLLAAKAGLAIARAPRRLASIESRF